MEKCFFGINFLENKNGKFLQISGILKRGIFEMEIIGIVKLIGTGLSGWNRSLSIVIVVVVVV